MTVDLFGVEPEPPRKNEVGYLAHVASLPYPGRHTFWALADGPRLDPELEWVWLIAPGGEWRRHMIDNRTGRVIA